MSNRFAESRIVDLRPARARSGSNAAIFASLVGSPVDKLMIGKVCEDHECQE